MSARAIYDALAESLDYRLGVRVRYKDESILMKVISVVLFFNPRFMTDYVTTIGRTVYFPRPAAGTELDDWQTLFHEGIHAADYARAPVRFVCKYLFPQGLAVFALLAFVAIPFSNWWLLSLLSLVALAPWPAPGRVALERRGYFATLVCQFLQHGSRAYDANYFAWIASIYTGPDYYWMSHDKRGIIEMVLTDAKRAERIAAGTELDPDFSPMAFLVRAVRDEPSRAAE